MKNFFHHHRQQIEIGFSNTLFHTEINFNLLLRHYDVIFTRWRRSKLTMLSIFESIDTVASEIESKISFWILNRITQCLSAPKSTKNNIISCRLARTSIGTCTTGRRLIFLVGHFSLITPILVEGKGRRRRRNNVYSDQSCWTKTDNR